MRFFLQVYAFYLSFVASAAASSFVSPPLEFNGAMHEVTERRKHTVVPIQQRHAPAVTHLSSRNVQIRGGAGQQQVSVPPLLFASMMSFLAGCSDVVCFQRFQYYTSMMTGNLIMTSVALAEGNWADAILKASLIASFFTGACTARSIEWVCKQNKHAGSSSNRQHLKFIAPIVLVLFTLYDQLALKQRQAINLLPLAYGMVYSSANQALGATITQLMTGHLTKLGTAISDYFLGPNKQWNKGSLMSFGIVGSFVVGAFTGLKISLTSFGKGGPFFTVLGLVYAALLTLY